VTTSVNNWGVNGASASIINSNEIKGTYSSAGNYNRIYYKKLTGSPLFYKNRKYRLTFEAYSNRNMTLSVYYGNPSNTVLAFGNFTTTTGWQSYSLTVLSTSNFSDTTTGNTLGLYFYIATPASGKTGDYTVYRNITLCEETSKNIIPKKSISLDINKGSMSKTIITFPSNSENKLFITFPSTTNNFTLFGCKLAEGNKYTPWEGTTEEQQVLITLNSAMQGTTYITGGLMLTNMIGMKGSNNANHITAGINGLDTDNTTGLTSDLRFWAGSTGWDDIYTAPFRVYEDGRVFGTNFYGYNGAVKITSSNKNNYITKINDVEYIDLIKTGSIIFLDRSLISLIKLDFSNNYINVTDVKLKFPDNIENYIGSTVTLINPFQILISNSAEINNIYNGKKISEGKDCYNEYTGKTNGISSGNVQELKENDTTYSYSPNFNIWYLDTGTNSAYGYAMYGYKSPCAVQTFRLMSTPYLSSSSTINGYLKRIESSAIVKNDVTYYRYGFWVLEDEIYNIEKPYS
jgi:hypothetical protein